MASAIMMSYWPSPRFASRNFKQDGWYFFKRFIIFVANGLHVPLAIVSTTMCASEVDVEWTDRLFANGINKTTSHGTLGDNVGSPKFFWGGSQSRIFNTSFTHLPKSHFKDGGRSRVLTTSMRRRYSKGSNFLSWLGFGPLTVSILCLWFYSSLKIKCGKGKIGQWP